MLLTAKNLSEIKYKTKRVALDKAEAEINVALIPTEMIEEAMQSDDHETTGLKILMASVVDDNGKPVFETPEVFKSLPLAVRNEILDAVHEYNGLGGNEELEKN